MINRIHIVNGPNLNLIGRRETDIYGTISLSEYFDSFRDEYPMVQVDHFQTNHEGYLIDYLHQHGYEAHTGIILNAGGLTHTSVSLRDAIASIDVPVIEVHISDIYTREAFRSHSYLTEVCVESFIGFGLKGYRMAIDFLLV